MVHYKLQYFGFRGFGEPIRLLFHYVGQHFEDDIINIENWPAYKPKTPYGHLPLLFIDGKVLAESRSIARFIAKEHNLVGSNNYEAERLNSIVDFLMDFRRSVFPYLLAKNGFKTYQDFLNGKISNDLDEMREKLYNELWIPNSQHALPILEKLLKEAGTGFFGKDGVTWVDFNVVEYINTLEGMDPETLNKYPELINFKQRVYELPQIKNYVETRKISPV